MYIRRMTLFDRKEGEEEEEAKRTVIFQTNAYISPLVDSEVTAMGCNQWLSQDRVDCAIVTQCQ